ncbi:hypothetical protein SAMN05216386_0517 [Nitrosospira briensis]|uniref:Phage tail protein (Tail_P2_I) n=1 Tax=Nitrosospira briensis TaxID=35799 RepID=A0A1I4Y4V9_9PROT|nr:hypothetical protein [Nitrosospira briensis]SFN33118.1 hypothetical protein SAMN05216386_0517 [Nitrosospira briensis]
MNESPDRLYELLPAVHRVRDAERGYPLRALLRVIGEQADVIEKDIARLYDNWFIETCDDWVVPYIGDLIGYRAVQDVSNAGTKSSAEATRSLNKVLVPRRDVAATLGSRRRKGTLALLELLANNVTGWPARAVEFYTLLGWTQHLDHQRRDRGRTADLRDGHALDLVNTPFEQLAHTVDVRRIQSRHSSGRHNIPTVGVFVWRLRSYSVTHAPAYCVENQGAQYFTFSVLGNDSPLYTRPEPQGDPTHIADEVNLPTAIRRRALEERLGLRPLRAKASATYYGAQKSIAIYAPGWPAKGAPQPIPANLVIPADLTDWHYRAPRQRVAVDPVLGRIVFPDKQLPKHGVWVTYHYAFSADMGGGEYPRVLSQPASFALYRVTKDKPGPDTSETINAALVRWRTDQTALGPEPDLTEEKELWRQAKEELRAAVIQIEDSSVYSESLTIELEAGESLQLRAANRTRPIIRLIDNATDRPDAFAISGKKASRFKLDGLMVAGRGLQVNGPDCSDRERAAEGDLCDVIIRHSTLIPGWELESGCEPKRPNEPSLELFQTRAKIIVEASIIGSIYVSANEVQTDPVDISISDSIVDATSEALVAIGAPCLPLAFARLSIVRSTVIGAVNTHAIMLGENSIFMSLVRVGRRQTGCMRFCYVTPDSRTPQRYHCQPDHVVAALNDLEPTLAADEKEKARQRESERVRPRFGSIHYGMSAYCQLAPDCAEEISAGAEDESEMGVFHDLFSPQRTANLRARLDEYTPAGMEAGILLEN